MTAAKRHVPRDFLVEIGTEELPPKSLLALATAFAAGIGKGLAEAGLPCKSIEKFATPRRLAVRVRRLAERQPDRAIERRGPPLKAAFFSADCIESIRRTYRPSGEKTGMLMPGALASGFSSSSPRRRMNVVSMSPTLCE